MLSFLKDAPGRGTPIQFSPSKEQKIIALACESPEDHEIKVDRWAHEMLAQVAAIKEIVKKISPSTVGLILNSQFMGFEKEEELKNKTVK